MSIDRCISNHDTVRLHSVGRPDVVFFNIVCKIIFQNGSVKRADNLNIQIGCLFQYILYLSAIFPDDTDIVAACFAVPVFFHVQRSEFSKTIGREKNLVCTVVGHHNFRPVYHRRKNKVQLMLTQRKCSAIFCYKPVLCKIRPEKAVHHGKCLSCGNYSGVWIYFQKVINIGRMIGLHMLDDQIVWLPVT